MDTSGHKCYDKSVYSAYSIKEVQAAADLATSVIVTGVVAECCVLSTVMSLIDTGKYIYYIYDAIAWATPETEQATMKVLGFSVGAFEIYYHRRDVGFVEL